MNFYPLGTTRILEVTDEVNAILEEMGTEHHAIFLDISYDNKGKFLSAHVTHYLGCERCRTRQNDKSTGGLFEHGPKDKEDASKV